MNHSIVDRSAPSVGRRRCKNTEDVVRRRRAFDVVRDARPSMRRRREHRRWSLRWSPRSRDVVPTDRASVSHRESNERIERIESNPRPSGAEIRGFERRTSNVERRASSVEIPVHRIARTAHTHPPTHTHEPTRTDPRRDSRRIVIVIIQNHHTHAHPAPNRAHPTRAHPPHPPPVARTHPTPPSPPPPPPPRRVPRKFRDDIDPVTIHRIPRRIPPARTTSSSESSRSVGRMDES